MKPIDILESLLERAKQHGMFGTKMRSVIADADQSGVEAIADQQFEYAGRIAAVGLVPILEPEVSIDSPHKDEAGRLLHDALATRRDSWPDESPLMFKVRSPHGPTSTPTWLRTRASWAYSPCPVATAATRPVR